MKHVGIIAEYNPFHNGHFYQISKVKAMFPDKKIIVCMSGDYVQRGEPALISKTIRCDMALHGGCDVVLSFPPMFSSASSEHFAAAGVLMLAKTGVIDTLCFGAECDDLTTLSTIADIFVNEPISFKEALKKGISNGLSFPKARANALKECYPDCDYESIINQPNNILAIEYIKTIKRYSLPITPVVIKRSSSNYNDLSLNDSICSASALRNATAKDNDFNVWKEHIPEASYNVLEKYPYFKPLFFSDMYALLQYRIISEKKNLNQYHECSEFVANQLDKLSYLPTSFNELIDSLTGKHITESRLRRIMLNILLMRTNEKIKPLIDKEYVPYIRILGFNEESAFILKEMKEHTELPIINKTANASAVLSEHAHEAFLQDVYESSLYRQIFHNKYGILIPSEYEQSVIIHRK
ncbi:MAG: nucleotidyltransferase family protein [Lachnospiraceae bacterium]|nr:nucleotidyltransferase family protein [Lachnospiraceae bacterium]